MTHAKKGKGKGLGKKIALIAILAVSLIIILFVAYFFHIFNQLNHNELDSNDLGIGTGTSGLVSGEIVRPDNEKTITNIALFGVDQRAGETQFRSDAIMVLSVDKLHNKIKLSSLMRDTRVEIEGHGMDKLGHAYFYGGPQLAVKTINQNFNLDITEYATVNFQEMAAIIDAVGGVDIELTEEERVAANGNIQEQSVVAGLPKDWIQGSGLQHLNGTQAVAYARIRYVGNADFDRTDRQRLVLQKVFDKALDMNPLQYPEFARKFFPTVETSLDMNDILSLASIMLRDVSFEDARFPTNSDLIGNGSITVDGVAYLNVDLETMAERLHAFIYDDIDPSSAVTGE